MGHCFKYIVKVITKPYFLFIAVIQHYGNAMHIYCLLIKLGVKNKKTALYFAKKYQSVAHKLIY